MELVWKEAETAAVEILAFISGSYKSPETAAVGRYEWSV